MQKRQDVVFEFLREHYPDCEIRYDKQLPDQQCSRARPDVLFLLPHRKLIVECDENSHKAERYNCEAKRMSNLASAGDILPTVFIRFNPDLYRDPEGLKRKIKMEDRLQVLKQEIDHWLPTETIQQDFITVVYLYYDGSEVRTQDCIPVDWKEE
jgi:hypothetical protein